MPRPRQSNAAHKFAGTYNIADHGPDKVTLPAGAPRPPDWLPEEVAEEFNRIVASLIPLGVLAKADTTVLVQIAALTMKMKRDVYEFNASDHSQLRMLQKEVGLSPLSRNSVGGAIEKPVNEFDNF